MAFEYAAFISYSRKDAAFARKLHRTLESYRIPASVGSFELAGSRKNRLYPVFRDREELAAGDLGERLQAALKASARLIVVCSPNAAASIWVEKEIQTFIELGRGEDIFTIVSDIAPLVTDEGDDATRSCFPPALGASAMRRFSAGCLNEIND